MTRHQRFQDPIDIVLFHVDGRVDGYQRLYETHCGPIRPCQVRDLGEMRYVLRSIERHAPWANRVILVVQDRRHVPLWIDHAEVEIVTHEEFIPPEHLPTFQVSTIQGHVHRIPGLSEHFIQWCDDYFLGAPVSPGFFFDESGASLNRVYDSPVWPLLGRLRQDLYMRALLNTREVLRETVGGDAGVGRRSCFLFPHMPVAIRRSWWAEMVESLRAHPWFEMTITRKARGDDPGDFSDIIVDLAYVNWVEMTKRRSLSVSRYARCAGMQLGRLMAALPLVGALAPRLLYGAFKIRNDPAATAAAMRRLARQRPRFYCVNDDAYDRFVDSDGQVYHDGFDVHPDSLRSFHEVIESLVPEPSRYEGSSAHEAHGAD